jgi:hypothetical protein
MMGTEVSAFLLSTTYYSRAMRSLILQSSHFCNMKDSSDETVALLVDVESLVEGGVTASDSPGMTAADTEKELVRHAIWLIFGNENAILSSKYAQELSCLEELDLPGVFADGGEESVPITMLQQSRLVAIQTFLHTHGHSSFALNTTMGEILRANTAFAKQTAFQNQANCMNLFWVAFLVLIFFRAVLFG